MNKKHILALFLACAAACSLTACSPAKDNSDKNGNKTPPVKEEITDTELEVGIKSAFAKKYGLKVSDTTLVKCDTKDGVYAVYACGDDTALSYETVGPITFIFPTTPHQMEISYYGRLYSASTAYDRGYLSCDDWLNIAQKLGRGWYSLDEEQWAEIKGTSDEIKSAFAKMHNISADTVWFSGYGEYNGAYPVMISAANLLYATVITYDNVGGVFLSYPSSQKMDVYYDGKFYLLPAAYEKGLLTNSDLIEIAKRYGGYYLTPQEEADIIAAYRQNADGEQVIISSFYGEANGYYALSVGVKDTAPYLNVTEEITVDGELFGKEYHAVNKIVYVNDFGISLYKDGSLYTLKYAMENKLISIDDFHGICERNGFYFVD